MRRPAFLLLISWLPLACSGPTGLEELWQPSGTTIEAYEPLHWYPRAWDDVSACLGVSGDVSRVTWLAVGDERTYSFSTPEGAASGRWVPPHDIYIAAGNIGNVYVVKHEMVHDLLQIGHHEHPGFDCTRA